jgi:hypothetical protein
MFRPRCRWENDIKMDIIALGFESIDLVLLAEDKAQ